MHQRLSDSARCLGFSISALSNPLNWSWDWCFWGELIRPRSYVKARPQCARCHQSPAPAAPSPSAPLTRVRPAAPPRRAPGHGERDGVRAQSAAAMSPFAWAPLSRCPLPAI
jgi:hypothetical protein